MKDEIDLGLWFLDFLGNRLLLFSEGDLQWTVSRGGRRGDWRDWGRYIDDDGGEGELEDEYSFRYPGRISRMGGRTLWDIGRGIIGRRW